MEKFSKNPLYIYDADIEVIAQTEKCTTYKMHSADGTGAMTCYKIFPGISLTYNDFHMGKVPQHSVVETDILEINHCREGRFECEFNNGLLTYLSEGDLAVNTVSSNRVVAATFPLDHYHGISICIELQVAAQMISQVLQDISIDLYGLKARLCANDSCFVMRAQDSIQHIFTELYTIPDAVKYGYLKIKVLELLLFLSVTDIRVQSERQYFQKSQVQKIKEIKKFITTNIEQHFTLEELAKRFEVGLTAMNACFKAVYGKPIYTYIRNYRMQVAAYSLRNSSESVTLIAGKVGYENSSKFASAFKAIMQTSPSKYRKS